MAIVDLTPTTPTTAGAALNYATDLVSTDVYRVRNPGNVVLVFKNINAATRTVTVDVPSSVAGQAVPDFSYTIAANTGDTWIAPLPPGVVNDDAGNIVFSVSAGDGLSVAALAVA